MPHCPRGLGMDIGLKRGGIPAKAGKRRSIELSVEGSTAWEDLATRSMKAEGSGNDMAEFQTSQGTTSGWIDRLYTWTHVNQSS